MIREAHTCRRERTKRCALISNDYEPGAQF